jgi:hypothetical protein
LLDDNGSRGFWLDKSRWTSQKWDPNSVRVTENLQQMLTNIITWAPFKELPKSRLPWIVVLYTNRRIIITTK